MEDKIRYCYRICPCLRHDIEGIQTWLEDLSAEGLVLEPDGSLFGFLTFQRQPPHRLRYRLTPVTRKKGFFSGSADAPGSEELEFSAQCGWEYVMRYGSFYIYRTPDREARPLHTDPAVQAMALNSLRKQRRNAVLSEVFFWGIYLGLRSSGTLALYRTGILLGLTHMIVLFSLFLWVAGGLLLSAVQLFRYHARLRRGDTLEQAKNWKKTAPAVLTGKLAPWVLSLILIVTWGIGLKHSSGSGPLEALGADLPFATLADTFPDAELDRTASLGDYNTALCYSNALSDNTEWKENADISGGYYGILRLQYHRTISPLLAKGTARDYYNDESGRFRGKRFEDVQAPETGLDHVQVFRSYGVLHIVIQHNCEVIHATVLISDGNQNNHWQLWLQATEQKLLAS